MSTKTAAGSQLANLTIGLSTALLSSCAPKSAVLYHNEAERYFAIKDYAKALKNYDRAIALNNSDADWYYQRGYAHELHGEVAPGHKEAALRDYTRAIELKGDHAPAYCRRGYVRCMFSSTKDPSQDGLYDLALSIEADSTYYLSYLFRGMFLFNAGRRSESCLDLSKAAQLKPESEAARLFRQQCQ
jgi:tetratricopeptide (TPR) repeat protein